MPALRTLLAVVATAAAAVLTPVAAVAATPAPPAPRPAEHVCPEQPRPGEVTCFALQRTDIKGAAGAHLGAPPAGYGPGDLDSAYNLPSATSGGGQTVAIVDAFDYPNAEAELAVYRQQYGLPACTTANGCFQRVDQRGGTQYPAPNSSWQHEEALDLDMVSAVCPQCHIVLVEADDPQVPNMGAAVNQAVAMGAKYVSNSYGANEDPSELAIDSAYYDHPGVVMTVSAGDYGYGVEFPASSPHVTSVGGTTLQRDGSARGWTESAWSGSGSGCSAYEPKPAFQQDSGCAKRSVADVSAVADLNTPVAVYVQGGWVVMGGTSVSSPIIAGVYALAGAPPSGSYPNTFPYKDSRALNDVTSGANGTCTPAYLCTGGAGYDGPTGLGSPNGIAAFTAGPTGSVGGTVTDSAGKALAGAVVKVGELSANTDSAGHFSVDVPAGTYTATASKFGYTDASVSGVAVGDGQTVTENFTLTVIPTTTISGVVRDGSGHGWPLAAQVQVAGQPTTAVHTDPVSGRYALTVPQGGNYSVQVEPAYPGYLQDSQQVQVGKTAVGHDVGIKVDPVTCGAPGYGNKFSGATQSFDGSSTPDGWTVQNNVPGARPWEFDNPGGRSNNTGGSGNFAVTESNLGGGNQDTTLTSPVYDLSAASNPTLTFGTDFEAYGDSMNASAEYTVDGGTTWTPVWRHNSQDASGRQVLPLPDAVGKSAVQVRFHYVEQTFGFWWEVDDVFVGDHACTVTPGGLVTGHVTDKVGGVPLSGATVTSVDHPADKTTTAGDGSYWFFSSQTGTHPVSGAATNYVTATKSATITPDDVTPVDFSLDSAQLKVGTTSVSKSVAWQGTASATIKVTNTGTAPADVRLDPRPGGYTPAAQVSAPLQKIKGTYSTGPLLGKAKTAAVNDASPSAASWQAVADYPTKIMDNAAVTVNGKVYSFTGLNGTELTTKNYVYDPGSQAWSPIADLKEARENPFAVAIGTKVYLAGGWGVSGPPNGDLEIYDTASNTWTTGAPMPTAYSAMGSAVVGGKIYVIGGCLQDSCGVTDVQVYDPATNTWAAGPSLPVALSWTSCGLIAGTLYCAGGASGLDYLSAGYGLSVATGVWSPIASLPVAVFAASSTVANGQLLVSGGIQDGSLTNAGYAYDPSTNNWSPLPNANATLFRGGSACGFYRVGGSAGGFSPTTSDQLLPGYDQCGEYVSIPWMSVTPTNSVTIAPGKSANFTVNLDASSLAQPGAYTATLNVGAVVPHPVAPIPVTFTVKPPATWGKITGTVTGLACKGGSPPIPGATVQIDTWAASYTLKTDAGGNYVLWLDNRNNPLTLIVARDGWQPQTRQVKITKGKSVTADFALKSDSC